ncbi:unnamed protein product [Caretta caretta]
MKRRLFRELAIAAGGQQGAAGRSDTPARAAGTGSCEEEEVREGILQLASSLQRQGRESVECKLSPIQLRRSISFLEDLLWCGGGSSVLMAHSVPGFSAETSANSWSRGVGEWDRHMGNAASEIYLRNSSHLSPPAPYLGVLQGARILIHVLVFTVEDLDHIHYGALP